MKKIILACMMLFPFMGIAAQESETRKQTDRKSTTSELQSLA